MTVLLLGDGLLRKRGPVARRPDEPILLIEAESFARRLPYHPHKLTVVFSAMRHFRDELRERGRTVRYYQAESFDEGLRRYFDDHPRDELVAMRPASANGAERFDDLVTDHGGTIEFVENELFLCSPDKFDEWAGDREGYRHEDFYRFMRKKTGYLMDGDEPVGGEWNYDEENRETPDAEFSAPEPPVFPPDETTEAVAEWVEESFDGSYDEPPYGGDWADPEPFRWPVTRAEALDALEAFCTERLPDFGPYQDAMVGDEWGMYHALLSPALNIGLLHPAEVVERVIEAGEDDAVPLNSVEGFVRQVIGWREFVRHVYRREMPDLAEANQLDAEQDLPPAYWTGDTEMNCLRESVEGVRERGYAHHIQRLMVLSNFGLLYGVEPAQLNRWFHAGFVDAYHWVTTPNVVEMGLFGSGVFATKPYAASANYINKMSDYCSGCEYYHTKTTGEGACPFNALYWDFLDRNGDELRDNHRMGLVYSHLDNKDDEELTAIRKRADTLRERARSGEL
jgi:deoxyribodipyrimidine photolyase-related protein